MRLADVLLLDRFRDAYLQCNASPDTLYLSVRSCVTQIRARHNPERMSPGRGRHPHHGAMLPKDSPY